jgi:hypothetical protein
MVWYLMTLAWIILFILILFGVGVFHRLEVSMAEEGNPAGHPLDASLSSDCIWHINAYIESLPEKLEDPSDVGAAVYEALSSWIASKYEEDL